MDPKLEEKVQIELPTGTLLVLFEYLAHSYDSWRKKSGQSEDDTFVLPQPDAAERAALWHLEGAIERTLPEIFSADYPQLIAQWKQHLTAK